MDLEPPSKSPLHGEESYGEVEARLAEEIHTAQDEGVSPEELAMQVAFLDPHGFKREALENYCQKAKTAEVKAAL